MITRTDCHNVNVDDVLINALLKSIVALDAMETILASIIMHFDVTVDDGGVDFCWYLFVCFSTFDSASLWQLLSWELGIYLYGLKKIRFHFGVQMANGDSSYLNLLLFYL